MQLKTKTTFQCDKCSKQEEGGKTYLDLPVGWNFAYFNNLGGAGNTQKHYCSRECFETELDAVLRIEKENRIKNFLIRCN